MPASRAARRAGSGRGPKTLARPALPEGGGRGDGLARSGPEPPFEAAARAGALEATGRDVIHLEIGEPDFDTPPNIRRAGARALESGHTHYGPGVGRARQRRAV